MKNKTLLIILLAVGGSMLTTGLLAQAENNFGGPVEQAEAISYDALLSGMAEQDSMEVTVEAAVTEVCQAKGCWMNLTSAERTDAPLMMVRFKDYGFFVPKDIAGRKVVITGKAYREMTPVEELRHYAEDAGKSKEEIEAITEPKEELKFLATGVVLLD